jgi:uncharacterized protein (TIGR03086 family)
VRVLDAYGQTLDLVEARVAGVTAEQFARPTPCSDWDVELLLGHLAFVIEHYAALPSGQPRPAGPAAPTPAPALDQSSLVPTFTSLASAAVAAWSQPGALERPCHHVMGEMPGWQALSIHISDVLVHVWDLSVATGQDDTLDPALADLALATLRDVLRLDEGRGRFFAPALTATGTDVQSRLLAYAGRSYPGETLGRS